VSAPETWAFTQHADHSVTASKPPEVTVFSRELLMQAAQGSIGHESDGMHGIHLRVEWGTGLNPDRFVFTYRNGRTIYEPTAQSDDHVVARLVSHHPRH
jgi:hypothetical protein